MSSSNKNKKIPVVYWPKKPGDETRCSDCIDWEENCYECMIDDLLGPPRKIDCTPVKIKKGYPP
jgi:hypothetical protein